MVNVKNQSNTITQGLLDYLSETGRRAMLPEVTQQLQNLLDESDRIKEIIVVSIQPLESGQLNDLKKTIAKLLDINLPVVNRIDKHLIGGFTIKIGEWFLDASVVRQLQELKKQLLV